MTNFQWIKADVKVTESADGAICLQNKIPLADYPANLCAWLHQNAEKFPHKPLRIGNSKGILATDAQSLWASQRHVPAAAACRRGAQQGVARLCSAWTGGTG